MPDRSALGQKMFSMIEDWRQSGVSQKTFCQQLELPLCRFYYWYKAYRKHNVGCITDFVALQVDRPLPKPIAGAGLITHIIIDKHVDHLPV